MFTGLRRPALEPARGWVEPGLGSPPPPTLTWSLVGDTRQINRDEADGDLLAALVAFGEADAKTLAAEIGKHRSTVQKALQRFHEAGRVERRAERSRGRVRLLYRPVHDPPQ